MEQLIENLAAATPKKKRAKRRKRMALARRERLTRTKRKAFTLDELVGSGVFGCRASAYKAISAGRLRAVKAGSRTLVLAEETERYLASLPPLVMKGGSAAS